MKRIDVAVVGGGAMGLATAWQLAPRARVALFERFDAGHDRGASHGNERVFRYLYDEDFYVQMAVAADEGWQRLERDAGRQLFFRSGSLHHGNAAEVASMAAAAARGGVPIEMLEPTAAKKRWPGMWFTTDVLLQPTAGWVAAADTLAALTSLAAGAGADLRFATPVVGLSPSDDGVVVEAGGETYVAESVVVTAGAWSDPLLASLVDLPPLLTTEEHVFFFRPKPDHADDAWPTWMHDLDGDRVRYGLPTPDGLYKIGEYHSGDPVTGDSRTFVTDQVRVERMARYVEEWMPGLAPEVLRTKTCLFTSTATHDFVLDRQGRIVVGAGFAGHGFKFVPEIGRRLAALALALD